MLFSVLCLAAPLLLGPTAPLVPASQQAAVTTSASQPASRPLDASVLPGAEEATTSPAATQPRTSISPAAADKRWTALAAAAAAADQQAREPAEAASRTGARLTALGEIVQLSSELIDACPTDPRICEAWEFRLAARMQILQLTGQPIEEVRTEAQLALKTPNPPVRLKAIADYYLLRADIIKLPRLTSAPTAWSSGEGRLIRKYLATHEDTPYAPELISRLADLAVQDGDPPSAIKLYRSVVQKFPQHPLARRALVAADRLDMVGRPLDADLQTPAGQKFKLSDFTGRWLLLAFLSRDTPDGPETITAICELLNRVPDMMVVIYSLDDTIPSLATWQGTWVLGVSANWPVHFDGKQFESPLIKKWGIRQLPTVWLVDPRGRLVTTDALVDAQRILFNAAPASQPAVKK